MEVKNKIENIEGLSARWQVLNETAIDGIITITEEGIIESVNVATCKLFGYTEGELLGNNIALLMPLTHTQTSDKPIDNYLNLSKRTVIGRKKDGTGFPLRLSVNPFKLQEQRMFMCVVHDITEQCATETALQELKQQLDSIVTDRTEKMSDVVNRLLSSNQLLENEIEGRIAAEKAFNISQEEVKKTERLFHQIIRNFPDGVISVLDTDFNVVFCGGELHAALKTLIDELAGKRLNPFISDETWTRLKAQLSKVFEGESLLDFEVPEKVLDQYFMFDAVPLYEQDGSIPRIAVYSRTITKLKRVEEELRNALKKEKELGLMKNRFISMASHEFRTPLSTILSSASLMVRYTETNQQDKRERHFNKIKSGVDMLTTILNDFLSLGRLEEGAVVVHNEIFDIHAFCQETKEDIQGILKQGQILKTDSTRVKEDVYLDKKLLKLILCNLISNASKYSDEGSIIKCDIRVEDGILQISISDKGIGIPEEDQKYLFGRFFRASNVTNIKGTGLGLHIVKRYVELLGGEISFESTFGEGSTFTIRFKTKTKS
jgi:PAS domain S-box-containing protein